MLRDDLVKKLTALLSEIEIEKDYPEEVEDAADSILAVVEQHMIPKRRDHLDSNGQPTYSFTWGEDRE